MGSIRTIRASASDNEVELFIMSEITSWTAQDAFGYFSAYGKDKRYVLNINSPGGDPFAAFAIHDYIKANGLTLTARIYGHAASAAAIIACACDRVEMGELSHLMIHNAYGGDNQELLDRLNANQADVFSAKTGKTKAAIRKMMDAETWMDARTAKSEGFADSIIKELAIAATYKASYMEQEQTKVEDPKPEGEEVKTEEQPAAEVEQTEEVEQVIEVTTAEAVQAAITGKLKAKVSVGKEIRAQLTAALEEVKEVKAKADEAISEAEALRDKLAKAEAELKAATDEAASAKADADALKAKVTEITAEVDKLKKAPLASAEGEPKGGEGVQVPGAASATPATAGNFNAKREAVREAANAAIDKATKRGNVAASKA